MAAMRILMPSSPFPINRRKASIVNAPSNAKGNRICWYHCVYINHDHSTIPRVFPCHLDQREKLEVSATMNSAGNWLYLFGKNSNKRPLSQASRPFFYRNSANGSGAQLPDPAVHHLALRSLNSSSETTDPFKRPCAATGNVCTTPYHCLLPIIKNLLQENARRL